MTEVSESPAKAIEAKKMKLTLKRMLSWKSDQGRFGTFIIQWH